MQCLFAYHTLCAGIVRIQISSAGQVLLAAPGKYLKLSSWYDTAFHKVLFNNLGQSFAIRCNKTVSGGAKVVTDMGILSAATAEQSKSVLRSSPIDLLPPEILSKIFEYGKTLEEDAPLLSIDSMSTSLPQIAYETALLHTSSRFREVALSNPRLWTSINLNATSCPQNINERIIRSAACRLDIRIDIGVQDPSMDDNSLHAMMDTILPLSLRWRTLCVRYGRERAAYPIVMQLCDSPAPNLEHLSITVDDVDSADPAIVNMSSESPHVFRNGTPKLEFIRLRGVAMHFFRPQLDYVVTLHLDQTRSLPLLYSTFRDIVTRSPFLSHLSVYGDIIAPADWSGKENSIPLPRLRSLRIYSQSGRMYSGILLGIEAPMLESLTFKELQEHDLDSLWEIVKDRSPKYPNLKQMVFTDDLQLSIPACERIFDTFPKISECSAGSFPKDSPLMSLLLNGMAKGVEGFTPCPKLKMLAFTFDCLDDGEDEEVIEGVVEIRKRLGFPLSKILLRIDKSEMEDKAWKNFDAGSDIEVDFIPSEQTWPEPKIYFDLDDDLFYF